MKLSEKISQFPAKPGVYLFHDKKGDVLYVGKAKSLRARVGSYFKRPKEKGAKAEFLLRRAADIDFIVTDNEKEALLLENTLIKKHHPRYNVQLRDDKTYVSIRIGLRHRFPGISILRRVLKDGAAYFGPFASSVAARETVDQVVKSFRIRTCADREFANRVRPCLEFDIGRCRAPCVGNVSKEEYCECISEALLFLKGSRKELIEKLTKRMKDASNAFQYEKAAQIRDVIERIKETLTRQKVVIHGGGDHDVIGLARLGNRVAVCMFMVRGGTLLDRRMHAETIQMEDDELIEEFLLDHYTAGSDIPSHIYTSHKIEGVKALESILSERRGGRVCISVPRRGAHRGMIDLAVKNATETLELKAAQGKDIEKTLWRLKGKLRLPRLPETIECLDISNLMGREAYGSLITFIEGRPEKSRYRLYTIRTLQTPDDYGMMREVLRRRFNPPIPPLEKGGFEEPDLLLIDGGKGQLSIAKRVLSELGMEELPVAAIAKTPDEDQDRIFLPGRKNSIPFKHGAPEILLLHRIRDEAHRFGITAHRKKRLRGLIGS
jgi:excinuclease ABC subunit C